MRVFAKRANASPEQAPASQADFIPYACHVSPFTTVTKNGELLQTIRLDAAAHGMDYEAAEESASLRACLREAVLAHGKNKEFAFWVHTIRRRRALDTDAVFPEKFARELDAAWKQAHPFGYSYHNEVYITVLIEGEAADLFKPQTFRRNFFYPLNRRHHRRSLTEAEARLTAVTGALLDALSPHFRGQVLGLKKRGPEGNARWYSEPLEFFNYLLTTQNIPMPVLDADMSEQLAATPLTFGFDAMETLTPEGKKRFAALLSVKGCPELSTHALDKFLQLPEEMVVTQAYNFFPASQAMQRTNEMIGMFPPEDLPERLYFAGLDEMYLGNHGKDTDFAEQQTTITLQRDHYKGLDEAVSRVQDTLSQLGMMPVREDLRLEECFWAQLPGNFEFLKRKTVIPSTRLGSFTRLNHFPTGQEKSPWGKPVAVFPTFLHTPYLFHFHHGEKNHALLLDFNSFADARGASLLNFLISNTRKFQGRAVVFDRNRASALLVKELGGDYLTPAQGAVLNPFTLENTPRNQGFLSAWLHGLMPAAPRDALKTLVEETLAQPQPSLRAAFGLAAARGLSVPALPLPLFGEGESARLFDSDVAGFGMDVFFAEKENRALLLPVFSYLLHRFILTLDGRPTLLVLNEAWDLLDNEFFTPRLGSLLEMLSSQNVVVVATTRRLEEVKDAHITSTLIEQAATRLFMPDDIPAQYLPELTGLDAPSLKNLQAMQRQKGHFLIKHGAETVSCSFDPQPLGAARAVLAGDPQALRLMQIQQR